jgi:hypothetical protein
MPDGVVQWFDPATGEAAVVRGGRTYPATAQDLEPVARHAGAHVHFDIHRDGGVDRAAHVVLREGTRVSHHQAGFGTLAGAHRPDTKGSAPFARPHPDLGLTLAAHPLEVARAWVRCLETRDLEGAVSLYAPDAELHAPGGSVTGRSRIWAHLEGSPMLGAPNHPEIRGDDEGLVLVAWAPTGRKTVGIEVRCRKVAPAPCPWPSSPRATWTRRRSRTPWGE